MNFQGISLKEFLKELWAGIENHNVFNGAAALAYYLMLSIFPAAIFILSLLPYLPIPNLEQAIMDLLGQALPADTAGLFTDVVSKVVSQRNGGLLSFGLLFLLWSASTGLYAIMQQINITYEVKEARPFWKARAVALMLMVLFFVLIIGAFGLVVFGGVIQGWIASILGWSEALLVLFATFRWVVIVLFLLIGFAVVYYFGPDVEQDFKFITPGSVLGVVLLILASLGFRFYVTSFGNYSATYGSLGGAIVLLLWLYIAGLVLLVGSEVNVLVEHYSPEGKSKGQKEERPKQTD